MLLQKDVLPVLSEQVEVVADSTCGPTTVTKPRLTASTTRKPRLERPRSTPTLTLYARVRNKRYTLAVCRLTDGDTASNVLAEFLGILDGLDFGIKAVYLDREFYDSKCLTLLQAHNYAYVMPIVHWGTVIKQELSEGWSRVIHHDLTTTLDGQLSL